MRKRIDSEESRRQDAARGRRNNVVVALVYREAVDGTERSACA